MLRLRLAALALASSVLVTVSGCATTYSEPFCPRIRALFTSRSAGAEFAGDCDCQGAHIAGTPDFATMQPGPQLVPSTTIPSGTPIPITTVPSTQPGVFRGPQAMQLPYAPSIK